MNNTCDPYNVISPAYRLLVYLNNHDEGKLINDEIQMLFKNLKSNFLKLTSSVGFVSSIQGDSDFISRNGIIKTQSIEFGFYNISSTWDVAFQIGKHLVPALSDHGSDKFGFLEKEFKKHQKDLPHLNLMWFRFINKIRNKIVHGGLNLIPFHENGRLSFQVYNNQVDELIPWSNFYCTKGRPIIFVDRYLCFHAILLYHLLIDYFKYLLFCLSGKFEFAEKINDDEFGAYESSFKHWPIDDYLALERIFDDMSKESSERVPFNMIEGESHFM